ncbi:unnamed protein product [Zymoseptoria tritici ST99CH_3D7]|uniref:Uncharacterized protein n=1 Tax=Zymoseptoria tritici (strain ST99CH_3D7) TaxID=1276538 RepID=A0A1X7S4C0_ZYMT9|nr:unnamed protein product [Zymoseptoria tritici ST99CH_3D7]
MTPFCLFIKIPKRCSGLVWTALYKTRGWTRIHPNYRHLGRPCRAYLRRPAKTGGNLQHSFRRLVLLSVSSHRVYPNQSINNPALCPTLAESMGG